MRLTLRTLIAWLDDTLTPREVKEIGQQVSEAPSVRELIERIHRVTRQRRLTVPSETGADATDPNLVAAYLDNVLAEEQVVDLEKRCLTSDVHLAEVASVHQILSMIGHKAKVPAEAKSRMYRLVRGREASAKPRPRPPRPATPTPPAVAARPGRSAPPLPAESPSHPAVRWTTPGRVEPRVLERFGPLAVVMALVAVLGYLGIQSMYGPESTPAPVAQQPTIPAPGPGPGPDPVAVPTPAQPTTTPPVVADAATAKVAPAAPPAAPASPVAETNRAEPPGTVGTIAAIQGIVLQSPLTATNWEPVPAATPVRAETRVINLAPFRNVVRSSTGEVTLVDAAEVVFVPAARDQAAEFDLRSGRAVVLGGAGRSAPYFVRFEGQTVTVNPDPGVAVGLERVAAFQPGTTNPAPAQLRLVVPEGKAVVRAGEAEQTLTGPTVVSVVAGGGFTDAASRDLPPWVASTEPSAFDKEMATQFAQYLRPNRPILANLVEAMDNPEARVRELAVGGLGSLGDMESVALGLDRRDSPSYHRAVVEILRTNLARGGDAARAVREALARQYEERWAKVAEQLLVGLPREAARDEAALAGLVDDLRDGPTRGIRALALDTLRNLTGRDSLEYDPDAADPGKGLRAWQDLARKKELSKNAPAPR